MYNSYWRYILEKCSDLQIVNICQYKLNNIHFVNDFFCNKSMFHEFIYNYKMMLTYLHKHVENITLTHPILYSEEFVKCLYMCKCHITAFFNLDML